MYNTIYNITYLTVVTVVLIQEHSSCGRLYHVDINGFLISFIIPTFNLWHHKMYISYSLCMTAPHFIGQGSTCSARPHNHPICWLCRDIVVKIYHNYIPADFRGKLTRLKDLRLSVS
jgi:hypothetical protein